MPPRVYAFQFVLLLRPPLSLAIPPAGTLAHSSTLHIRLNRTFAVIFLFSLQSARIQWTAALALKPKDGPCGTMLAFLKDEGGIAPPDWPGYRELEGY